MDGWPAGHFAKHGRGQRDVRQVTEQTMDESRGNRDDFYVFSARSGDAQNTVEMLIQPRSQGLSSLPPLSLREDPGSRWSRGTRRQRFFH